VSLKAAPDCACTPKMRQTILLALVLAVGLVCGGIVLFSGSATPAITVQHVKAVQSGSATTVTFEITNNTAQFYRLDEFAVLDVLREGAWKLFNYSVSLDQFNFLQFRTDLGPFDYTLGPKASRGFTSEVTNLRKGSALRLEITFHAGAAPRLPRRERQRAQAKI